MYCFFKRPGIVFVFSVIAFFLATASVRSTSACELRSDCASDHANIKKWHFSLGGEAEYYKDLHEEDNLIPAEGMMADDTSLDWKRSWIEKRLIARLSYDILKNNRFSLRPGITLGMIEGRFRASSESLGFSETWTTETDFHYGLFVEAQWGFRPQGGPFLWAMYDYGSSGTEEKTETIISDNPQGGSGSSRKAYFNRKSHTVLLGVGWASNKLKSTVGIGYTVFDLHKRLDYNIPESSARGEDDLTIIRSFNAEDSYYHYRNDRAFAPFLRMEVKLTPNSALKFSCYSITAPRVGLAMEFSH